VRAPIDPLAGCRAHQEGWIGEIEGLDLTLSHLRGKGDQARRSRATGLGPLG
jgi:hypothetical protein